MTDVMEICTWVTAFMSYCVHKELQFSECNKCKCNNVKQIE